MKFTGERIIQKIVAVLIIMVMTLADITLVGINVISYAVDMVATNSNNVEFSAYFVNEDKEKVTNIESEIDKENLKLYLEVAVKNEGYFNGKISLENASFSFKDDISSEYVKKVEKKSITLNKINAGTTATMKVGIEFDNSDEIEMASLNGDNEIKLNGTYVNSKKDKDIKGSTKVHVDWKSQEKLVANLGSKILTNSIYKVDEVNKRIVQVLVDSKLANNSYPVKSTTIELNIPDGAEEVKVHSRSTYATNGVAQLSEDSYKSENGKLTINIENNENNGKIKWNKNVKDTLIVTYIYPEEIDLTDNEIAVNSTIVTYDDKELKAESTSKVEDDIDGIVTDEIQEKENSIYKGKIYTGEKRSYTSRTKINIDYAPAVEEIEVLEKKSSFITNDDEEKKAKTEFSQSKINKSEFEKLFGQDGNITILDQYDNVMADITKDSETDDNGDIIVKYNEGTDSITVKTSKPVTEGTLNIEHKKNILNNKLDRKEVRNIKEIKEEVKTSYVKTDSKNNSNIATKAIELKETSSDANIRLNTQKLSTITTNSNVEVVATLETNDESKDLYKNPKVKIEFPKEIVDVKIKDKSTALYKNGLEVVKSSKTRTKDGNIVITVEFKGEQKKYDSKILNGLEIHFFADIIVNKETPSKDVSVKMAYINENGINNIYNTETRVHLESQYGLMLYNTLDNYSSKGKKLEAIDNENIEAKLDKNAENIMPTVKSTLINNYSKDLKNIEIIGKLPSQNDENTIDANLLNLKVSNNAKIYYNTKPNAKSDDKGWTQNSKNAKSYKIDLKEIKSGNAVEIEYDLDVEDNLSYNEAGQLITDVNYNYAEKDMNKTSIIGFATEKANVKIQSNGVTSNTKSGLQVNVLAVSGNRELKQGDSIYDGETIKYTINITNNTGKDQKQVKVKATQSNGKIFDLVEKEVFNAYYDTKSNQHYWNVTDSNIKEFDALDIPDGKTVSLEYQAVVDKTKDMETYGDINIVSADNSLKENISTIKNKVKDAEIKLMFIPNVSEETNWVSKTSQQANLTITNMTDTNLKDVDVQITLSKELSCDKYEDYIEWNSDIKAKIKNKEKNSLGQTIVTLNIEELLPKQSTEIYVRPYILAFDGDSKNVELYAIAKTSKNINYVSNNIIRKVTQVEKNIEVSQTAKINGNLVNNGVKANNGDTLEFNTVIKNADKEKVDLNVSDYIELGLDIKNITLIKNDNSKEDITKECQQQYFGYNLSLNPDEQVTIVMKATLNVSILSDKNKVINEIQVCDNNSAIMYSAKVDLDVNYVLQDDGKLNITAKQESKIADGSTVSNGDKIEYVVKLSNTGNFDRKIDIYDYINTTIKNPKVTIDNKDITEQCVSDHNLEIKNYNLKANSNTDIKIQGTVDLFDYNEKEISNETIIKSSIADTKSNTITYYASQDNQQQANNQGNNQNNEGNGQGNSEGNNQNTNLPEDSSNVETPTYTVSGKVWIDNNENGQRDDNEEIYKGMNVRAINTKTGEVLSTVATTSEDGSYNLNLPQGKYIIAFMYNNEDYFITTYQAKNISDDKNSDAVTKTLKIDDTDQVIGSTDIIDLSSNKENIDLGLVYRNKFDLKLSKTVTKMVVTNDGGTETYDFDDSELAKTEIHSKYLSGSKVVIEYKIKITNVGDIEGYVKNIVDYMPKDLTFSSSLNKDWYQSGNYLYNESMADTKLGAGESTEVKLILTKTMTESNTGLVNNTAAIHSSYNSKSFSDADSENNNSSADVIISVKTGAAIRLALLTFSLTIVIAGIAYFIMKKYISKKI